MKGPGLPYVSSGGSAQLSGCYQDLASQPEEVSPVSMTLHPPHHAGTGRVAVHLPGCLGGSGMTRANRCTYNSTTIT